MLLQFLVMFGILLSVIATRLSAVEKSPESLPYRLVGTIWGNQQAGLDVVVLEDLKSGKTLTVRVGEIFGAERNYRLTKVSQKQAWIKIGSRTLSLEYSPWASTPAETIDPVASSDPFDGMAIEDAIEEQDENREDLVLLLQEFRPAHMPITALHQQIELKSSEIPESSVND